MKLNPVSGPHARYSLVQQGGNCSPILPLESESKRKKMHKISQQPPADKQQANINAWSPVAA